MKLSIILITYNQEPYIRQSLDSLLMQRMNFDCEVVVADDRSTDRTPAIIQEYAQSSTINFNFLSSRANLGFVKNYERAFASCKGEYVAVMEGDDYWIDPNRLSRHIEFLDAHFECVMSMNRYITLHQPTWSYSLGEWNLPEDHQYITTEQMAQANRLGNLSACVFRGSRLRQLPPDLFDLEISDWMIGMVLGQYGPLAILREPTSVYRVHSSGQWSKLSAQEQKQTLFALIDKYDQYLEYKYTKEFNLHKERLNGNAAPPAKVRLGMSDFVPPVFMRLARKVLK